MGRRASGWKFTRRRGIYGVRWIDETGTRHERSTGSSDAQEAARIAADIYARAVSGRLTTARSYDPLAKLDVLIAEWLVSLEGSYDPRSIGNMISYSRRWLSFFRTLSGITRASVADYCRARLRQVLRKTLRQERTALKSFLSWCHDTGALGEMLTLPPLPRGATGVRSGKQRARPVPLTDEQASALVAALPLQSEKHGFWIRPYFVVLSETSLRPVTVRRLEEPKHWSPDRQEIRITADIDKVRYDRVVPISDAAHAALKQVSRGSGLLFGAHDYRDAWRKAVEASGAPAKASPYDLRHHRITYWAETGNLLGTAGMAGHRDLSTTSRYAHARGPAMAALLRGKQIPGTSGDIEPFSGADSEERRAMKQPNLPGAKVEGRTRTGFTPPEPESDRISLSARDRDRGEASGTPEKPGVSPDSGDRPQIAKIRTALQALHAYEAEFDEAWAQAIRMAGGDE